MDSLTITRPDDWHVHLRDGAALVNTCADLARYFGRAIVMPNLTPPVATVAQASLYRERILRAMKGLPRSFKPLMTLYLTDQTDAAEIQLAAAADFVTCDATADVQRTTLCHPMRLVTLRLLQEPSRIPLGYHVQLCFVAFFVVFLY